MQYPGLHPLLRTWAKTGLEALLLSEERATELRLSASSPSQNPSQSPAQPADHKRPLPPEQGSRAFTGELSKTSSINKPGSSNYEHLEQREQKAVSSQKEASARANQADPTAETSPDQGYPALILPLEAWPEPWISLKNRRPLPPAPLVLWTYAGLEDDLLGKPSAPRQKVIARLLKGLQHPGGTHVFWPFALPQAAPVAENQPDIENQPSLFWSGVALLRPRVLIVFGSVARDALFLPRSLRPHQQCRKSGCLVYQLPQPENLLTEEAFRSALAFLSNGLSFCRKNV